MPRPPSLKRHLCPPPRGHWLRPPPWCGALVALLCILMTGAPLQAQGNSVGGTVVNERSLRPLSGVQVVIEGTGRGTITNAAGRFQFVGLSGTQVTLRVVRIGYEPVTRTVEVGDNAVDIALSERAVSLDEIVVTGTAGGTEKRKLGNVVSQINAADVVETQPVNNVTEVLNGRVPGVVVLPGTGQVGSGSRIRVRGLSSLSLGQEPLLYVDGVRVNNAQGTGPVTQGFGSSVVSRINDFNPEDIQSIEVIKGPAAATLYGTEAANGVIQIITKKGAIGAPRFALSVKQGANWFANPSGRLYTNFGVDPRNGEVTTIDQYDLEKSGDNRLDGQGTDLFRTGHLQEYDLSVSGGSEGVRYYVGGSWENNEGIQPDNEVRKWSGRANMTIAPVENFDIVASVGYVQGRTDLSWESGAGGITWSTYFARPDRLYNKDGSLNFRRGFWSGTPEVYYAFQDWQDVERFTGSLQFNHRPAPWFTQRLAIGIDQTLTEDVELIERNEAVAEFFASSALGYREQANRNTVFNTMDYSGTLNLNPRDNLTSNTSLGLQFYREYLSRVSAVGEQFPAPGLRSLSAAAIRQGSQNSFENTTVGVFVQQQFGFNDRFFLTGAVRADDNSAFGENFDIVYYPKVSASWVISEEPFWSFGAAVPTVKLRAAYGESGQQPGAFDAIRTFSPVTGPGDVASVTPGLVGNPDLGPERGREIEVGFDAGFLDNRVGLELTYYRSTTDEAILLRDVPPSTGFSGSQFINAGEIRNSGLELVATARPVVTSNVEWDIGVNFASNSNEIISLGDPDLDFVTVGTFQQHRVGFPVASWFEKKLVDADFDADGKPTNLMCDNGSGGTVACADAPLVYLGRPTPDIEGSFNSALTLFKDFRIGALLDYKIGHTKLDGDRRVRCWFFSLCEQNYFPERFDATEIAGIRNRFATDILFPADFLKLREVSGTYSIPARFTDRFGTSRATLTLAARNLYTWTEYPGLEPEAMFLGTGSRGGQALWEQNVIPQLAQFVATINVSF